MADEVWRNPNAHPLFIQVPKPGGIQGLYEDKVVPAGGQISITYDTRKYNQAIVASSEADFFLNGSLLPVELFDADDKEEIASNPNLIGDSEIETALAGPIGKLRDLLADVENLQVLGRFEAVADEQGASKAKAKAISDRIAEVVPEVNTNLSPEADRDGYTFTDLST